MASALSSAEHGDELDAFGSISLAGLLAALDSGADVVQAIGALADELENIPISELMGWIDALTRLDGRIDASTMLAAQVDVETQLKGTIG